jgi:hypothetical protein
MAVTVTRAAYVTMFERARPVGGRAFKTVRLRGGVPLFAGTGGSLAYSTRVSNALGPIYEIVSFDFHSGNQPHSERRRANEFDGPHGAIANSRSWLTNLLPATSHGGRLPGPPPAFMNTTDESPTTAVHPSKVNYAAAKLRTPDRA